MDYVDKIVFLDGTQIEVNYDTKEETSTMIIEYTDDDGNYIFTLNLNYVKYIKTQENN